MGCHTSLATLTGNSSDHVMVFFACAKAGLVLVPLSWRLSPRELAAQLELADPQLLLVEDELESRAAGACTLLAYRPRTAALSAAGTAGVGARGLERGGPEVRRLRSAAGSARRRPPADDLHLRHRRGPARPPC